MAKKRVHEIAKERGISSKEVLAVLQKAGLDVKAAASSVDEDDIRRAFSTGGDGAQAEQQATGSGDGAQGRPQPRAETQERGPGEPLPQQRGPQPPGPGQQPPRPEGPRERPQRPQRRPEQGGAGPAGRRRRGGIDSQASRRPQTPPPLQQPPRRGRGPR